MGLSESDDVGKMMSGFEKASSEEHLWGRTRIFPLGLKRKNWKEKESQYVFEEIQNGWS